MVELGCGFVWSERCHGSDLAGMWRHPIAFEDGQDQRNIKREKKKQSSHSSLTPSIRWRQRRVGQVESAINHLNEPIRSGNETTTP